MTAERDSTTLRRAVRAGTIVGLVAGVAVGVLAAVSDLGLGAALGAALVVGLFAAAGWLLLAALLDIAAGERIGKRRALWTLGASIAAMMSPFLLLGVLFAAERASA